MQIFQSVHYTKLTHLQLHITKSPLHTTHPISDKTEYYREKRSQVGTCTFTYHTTLHISTPHNTQDFLRSLKVRGGPIQLHVTHYTLKNINYILQITHYKLQITHFICHMMYHILKSNQGNRNIFVKGEVDSWSISLSTITCHNCVECLF